MRKALALAAAAALTVGVAGGANAVVKKPKLPKAKPFSYADASGDANGINGQGLADIVGQDVPSQSTPSDRSAADIVKVTYARTDDGKKVTGLTVTMQLSAAPDRATIYRATSAVSDCSIFWFEYDVDPTGAASGDLQHNCGNTDPLSTDSTTVKVPVVVKGTSIVWTLPLALFPSSVKVGSTLDGLGAEARGDFVAVTAPVIDQAASNGAYKIGA